MPNYDADYNRSEKIGGPHDPGYGQVSETRRPSEIRVLVGAIQQTTTELTKMFDILRERLSSVTNRNVVPTETSEMSDKRGCETELGDDLGGILDHLQLLRNRIECTVNTLEL